MFNLFSGEFYKWKKSKVCKVCLAAAIGMILFIYLMLMLVAKIQNGEMENGTGGVVVTESNMEEEEDVFAQYGILGIVSEITGGGFELIFIAVFTCIWVVGEYSNGAIKNMVGKGYSRGKVFLSKYITTAVSVIVMNLILFLTMLLLGVAVMGTGEVNGGFFRAFFSYVGVQLLLSVAFCGVLVAVCEFARNIAVGITISMVLVIFSTLILSGVDLLFQALHLDVKASTYWIMNVMSDCPMGAIDLDFMGRAVSVAVMWTVLSLLAGMIHIQQTDIA